MEEVTNNVLWIAEEKWKAKGWEIWFVPLQWYDVGGQQIDLQC